VASLLDASGVLTSASTMRHLDSFMTDFAAWVAAHEKAREEQ
jgi:hypothetical protein